MTEEKINNTFFKLRITRLALMSVFIMLVIQIGFIIIRWHTFPPKIPLFFSLPWGEEQLADSKYLFLFPILSIGIVMINTILSTILHHKEPVLSSVFTIATVSTILIGTIGMLKIIFLLS